MSPTNGGKETSPLKREPEDLLAAEPSEKKLKTEPLLTEAELENLFEPLPFETKDGAALDFSADNLGDIDLPDFLSDSVGKISHLGTPLSTSKTGTPGPLPADVDLNGSSRTPNGQTPGSTGANQRPGSAGPAAQYSSTPLYASQSQKNPPAGYSYPNTGASATSYRPPVNGGAPNYRTSTRFDPKKTYPAPTSMSMPAVPMTSTPSGNLYNAPARGQDKDKAEDPSKLNDALAAAGVDIQREEELLSTNYNRNALNIQQQQIMNRQRQSYGQLNSFLHPYDVALFMNRVARENGVMQNFMVDPEMLDFMSGACKEWISGIVTKTAALAKHRRRAIPAFNPRNKANGKQKVIPSSQRSEVAKELRNLALKQKEMEERRVAKRALLGLEKSDEVAPESGNKAGADETLHRAANATAAMMTSNPSRKKYSWMTSGAAGTREDTKSTANNDFGQKQSSLISARGENGLRFREIRTGNHITSKDLLGVLEDERMGTTKAVIKGYARLKD